jgi:hypothetical protein
VEATRAHGQAVRTASTTFCISFTTFSLTTTLYDLTTNNVAHRNIPIGQTNPLNFHTNTSFFPLNTTQSPHRHHVLPQLCRYRYLICPRVSCFEVVLPRCADERRSARPALLSDYARRAHGVPCHRSAHDVPEPRIRLWRRLLRSPTYRHSLLAP